ncbi:MAG: hypothetical protein U0T81_01175 [Saprospiraceae bacterium]
MAFVITENSLGCITEDTFMPILIHHLKGPTTYICGGSNKDYVQLHFHMFATAP